MEKKANSRPDNVQLGMLILGLGAAIFCVSFKNITKTSLDTCVVDVATSHVTVETRKMPSV